MKAVITLHYSLYESNNRKNSDTRSVILESGESVLIGRARHGHGRDAVSTSTNSSTSFDCPVMSRTHARLGLTKENLLFVEDCRSTHGTSVNGKKLTPLRPHFLCTGDEIVMGDTVARNGGKEPVAALKVSVTYKLSSSEPTERREPAQSGVMGQSELPKLSGLQGAVAELIRGIDDAFDDDAFDDYELNDNLVADSRPVTASEDERKTCDEGLSSQVSAAPTSASEKAASLSSSSLGLFDARSIDVSEAVQSTPITCEDSDPDQQRSEQKTTVPQLQDERHVKDAAVPSGKKRKASESLEMAADAAFNPSSRKRVAAMTTLNVTAGAVLGSVATISFLCSPLADRLLG